MGNTAPKSDDQAIQSNGSEPDEIDFGAAEFERPASRSSALTVGERIALGTHGLRKTVAVWMTIAFLAMNGLTMFGLYLALNFDFRMIEASHPNYTPFVTEKVVMSLLGATTIQLGAITFTMAKFLFPNRSNGS